GAQLVLLAHGEQGLAAAVDDLEDERLAGGQGGLDRAVDLELGLAQGDPLGVDVLAPLERRAGGGWRALLVDLEGAGLREGLDVAAAAEVGAEEGGQHGQIREVNGGLVAAAGAVSTEDQLGEVAEEEAARALVAERRLDEGPGAAGQDGAGAAAVAVDGHEIIAGHVAGIAGVGGVGRQDLAVEQRVGRAVEATGAGAAG